jgi:hypothetical protein
MREERTEGMTKDWKTILERERERKNVAGEKSYR